MRLSRSRIKRLEQRVKATVAERGARAEVRRQLESRYAEEWELFKGHMTREMFNQWKQTEEKYLTLVSEKNRNQWPSWGATEEELSAAHDRILSTFSAEAQENYKERYHAFQAAYLPRFTERAVMRMENNSRWGGLDEICVMHEVHEEVVKKMGYSPNDFTNLSDDGDDDWERQNDIELAEEESDYSTFADDLEEAQARALAADQYDGDEEF